MAEIFKPGLVHEKQAVPPESARQAPQLAQKLENVMRDRDLSLVLGNVLDKLLIPGMLNRHELTEEQAERIRLAYRESLDSMLSPQEREEVDREADKEAGLYVKGKREKLPDFARW